MSESMQEQFNKACALTLRAIFESRLSQMAKEQLAENFLKQAKAAADDKSCDVLKVTARAAQATLDQLRRLTGKDLP
jgi:hypothetical protein